LNSVLLFALIILIFVEHPKEKCLDRLKLAGNAGWISLRLNRRPPDDDIIVEMVSIDPAFDPYCPEMYHLEKQRRMFSKPVDVLNTDGILLNCPQDKDVLTAVCSVAAQPYYYPYRNCMKCSVQSSSNRSKTFVTEEKCLICLTDERTATLVHGETGHIACCLGCARILKARGDRVGVMIFIETQTFDYLIFSHRHRLKYFSFIVPCLSSSNRFSDSTLHMLIECYVKRGILIDSIQKEYFTIQVPYF